ncbi:MAG TPA: hypothetical protein VG965_00875, partial [Patescibacteria group bacterium]|nr:hypothetical protein [Patescibacteria group bacterium]
SDDVLAELAKKNTLGIFSEGNLEFQRRKLSAAGIANYFDEEYVFIYRRKLLENAILTVPQAATIVDNKYDVVSELSNVANVVWINRESGENDPKIKTIHSLGELIKIFV